MHCSNDPYCALEADQLPCYISEVSMSTAMSIKEKICHLAHQQLVHFPQRKQIYPSIFQSWIYVVISLALIDESSICLIWKVYRSRILDCSSNRHPNQTLITDSTFACQVSRLLYLNFFQSSAISSVCTCQICLPLFFSLWLRYGKSISCVFFFLLRSSGAQLFYFFFFVRSIFPNSQVIVCSKV